MFVAVTFDLSEIEKKRGIESLLREYGFEKRHEGLWETVKLKERYLARLKRDIDRLTDSYDNVRLYQYPIDGVLVVTGLQNKRWRRIVVRP
ncbi:CRISPR-associated protein Cas2 [Sediminispirochaeta smaragdinae]|jgi:CRISPR-associated protein Cas2|uniref:CRISPR-associated endoribonuclease Cas2 n=1 Tax=Sediminispirochaeta smaragdinae (strain DSM 11293 / JCM 15392 / SEBR 4228) TaxID=573413 RepID=E1R6M5_SEDSS|nr:CRISPR-associated protein Cas2 [Sediminispirochaeta smaragdinae]ADK81043.1 CRISPR-associated protein Cas2 [Sediminispirochaeta smaragdinae DSM 11293]